MRIIMLEYFLQQHENYLLIGGQGSPLFFCVLKINKKNHRTVKNSVISANIKKVTSLIAANVERGLSKPLEVLKRLGAPMNILRWFVSFGNGCKSQHPQTMQGGAA